MRTPVPLPLPNEIDVLGNVHIPERLVVALEAEVLALRKVLEIGQDNVDRIQVDSAAFREIMRRAIREYKEGG